jgi:hypothetical protein
MTRKETETFIRQLSPQQLQDTVEHYRESLMIVLRAVEYLTDFLSTDHTITFKERVIYEDIMKQSASSQKIINGEYKIKPISEDDADFLLEAIMVCTLVNKEKKGQFLYELERAVKRTRSDIKKNSKLVYK